MLFMANLQNFMPPNISRYTLGCYDSASQEKVIFFRSELGQLISVRPACSTSSFMAFGFLDVEAVHAHTLLYTIGGHQLPEHGNQLRIRCEGVQRMSIGYEPDEVTIVTFLQRMARKWQYAVVPGF